MPSLAADPSFVFLWVGSGAGEGLERGREVLGKWGYRRCEDVCWIKTNKESNHGPGVSASPDLFDMHSNLTLRAITDRPADNVFVDKNEATLSHRHPRDGATIFRQLVRSL